MLLKICKNINLCLSLLLIFSSCNRSSKAFDEYVPEKVETIIDFSVGKDLRLPDFDSIWRKNRIIHLNGPLIGGIDKVQTYESRLFIFDRALLVVHCYDKTGEFKFTLSSIGKGPEEYFDISDMIINTENGNIEMIVDDGKTFLIYNQEGKFLEKRRLPHTAISFCQIEQMRYFYKGLIPTEPEGISSRVFSLNLNSNKVKKHLYFQNLRLDNDTGSSRAFSKVSNDGSYTFLEPYNDTIYQIDKEGFRPKYWINFRGNNFQRRPKDFLYNSRKYSNRYESASKLKFPTAFMFVEYKSSIVGYYDKFHGDETFTHYFVYNKNEKRLTVNSNYLFSKELKAYLNNRSPVHTIFEKPANVFYSKDIEGLIGKEGDHNFTEERKAKLIEYFEYTGERQNPSIILYDEL